MSLIPPPPTRDPKYLAWIRTLPCAACGVRRGVQAAHSGIRGLSQIADDRSAIPLCARHHDRSSPQSIHALGRARFEEIYGLDIGALVATLSAKPRLFIVTGMYVTRLLGEEYVIGSLRSDFPQIVRKLLAMGRDLMSGMLDGAGRANALRQISRRRQDLVCR